MGKVWGRYQMGKHLQLTIEEDRFHWRRKGASIEREAALDGIYVVRISVPANQLPSGGEACSKHSRNGNECATVSGGGS